MKRIDITRPFYFNGTPIPTHSMQSFETGSTFENIKN